MSLEDIRKDIDRIDKELVLLLKERMNCSLKVAEIKKTESLPIYHPAREQEILDRVNDAGGEFGRYIESVYRELMNVSREAQQAKITGIGKLAEDIKTAEEKIKSNVVVACQGIEGAFSNIAAENLHSVLPFIFSICLMRAQRILLMLSLKHAVRSNIVRFVKILPTQRFALFAHNI